jgi:pimeloyl-ACP methyl ester carboxylesterase
MIYRAQTQELSIMPFVTTDDDVRLFFEETGTGVPLLFIHEFAGDGRSWEPQVRHFSRHYRCVVFNARGYPPSDVPSDAADYSQDRAVADALAVLDHLSPTEPAHVVGLSMGGFCALHLGLQHPARARSLVVAGCGYGAQPERQEQFRTESRKIATHFSEDGAAAVAKWYAQGPSRVQFQNKDPRGWAEFARQLAEHDSVGAALTMEGVQSERPSLYALQAELRALTVPTLIVTGDEDDGCLEPDLMLKRTIPASGLAVLPKTGHTCNLEDPARFNAAVEDFLHAVENDAWGTRDPRATIGSFTGAATDD